MLDRYRRARWLFLGVVAKMACDYDETADAVIVPLMAVSLSITLWFATTQAIALGTVSGYILASFAALIAAVVTGITVGSIAASIVYATQATELPAGEEVVTRE